MSVLRKEGVEPNLEAIHEAAKIVGVKFGATKVPEKLVAKLRAYFDKKLKDVQKEDWIICPVCEEITDDDERLLRCPFCGDEGEDEETEVENVEELRNRDKDEESEEPEEDDSDESEDEDDEVEAIDGEDEDDEVEAIDGEDFDDSLDPVEPPVVDINSSDEDKIEDKEKQKIKPAKRRGTKTAIVSTDSEFDESLEVDNGEEIAADVLADMKVELDKEREVIEREYMNMYGSSYELGQSLRRVYRGQLWKADKIKTWRSFCAQIGISHTLAYNLIKMVSEFDRETFVSVGRTKLQLVARAENVYGLSGEQKDKLLDDAKNGASTSELKNKIKEEQKKNDEKSGKGKENVSIDGKPGRQKKEDQLITLLAKVGGRAKSYSFRDRKSHNELEKWENNSYIEIPISDTVVQYLVLKTDENGEIIGVSVAFRKVEQSSNKAA